MFTISLRRNNFKKERLILSVGVSIHLEYVKKGKVMQCYDVSPDWILVMMNYIQNMILSEKMKIVHLIISRYIKNSINPMTFCSFLVFFHLYTTKIQPWPVTHLKSFHVVRYNLVPFWGCRLFQAILTALCSWHYSCLVGEAVRFRKMRWLTGTHN